MSKVQEDTSEKRGKGGKGVVIIVAFCVIIAALVGVILYLLKPQAQDEEKRNVVITPENVEEVIKDMEEEEYVAPGYYTVSMSNEWHFKEGNSVSEDAFVQNDAKNTNDVFFDVFIAGDEEHAIYKSPIIPRGSSLEQIALEDNLEAGNYDCIVIYHLVDDEQNTLSTLRVGITIIVEN